MRPDRVTVLAGLAVLTVLAASLSARPAPHPAGDPLPSWRDGAAKQAILAFVERVTDEASHEYVPPAERVVVIDNDGTLICEKPTYSQLAFLKDRALELVADDPSLAEEEPFSLLLAGTLDPHVDPRPLLDLVARALAGITQDEFTGIAEGWLATARDRRFERPWTELVYAPMVELVAFLAERDFDVWICTAGGGDFVRCYAYDVYGIPPERVIGSQLVKHWQEVDGRSVLVRDAALVPPLNDGAGKPVNIERRIGRVPILAIGNSDGDLPMMLYTDEEVGPDLAILVHHDDAEREYAYDTGAEKVLAVAAAQGWTVVSMERDFERVFSATE